MNIQNLAQKFVCVCVCAYVNAGADKERQSEILAMYTRNWVSVPCKSNVFLNAKPFFQPLQNSFWVLPWYYRWINLHLTISYAQSQNADTLKVLLKSPRYCMYTGVYEHKFHFRIVIIPQEISFCIQFKIYKTINSEVFLVLSILNRRNYQNPNNLSA